VSYSTLTGETKKEQFSDYAARIIQHEVDHLDGVLFIDRMAEEELSGYQHRLERYITQYGEGGTR
jgi:peptide deformylase